jgi:hypothetical protein
MSINTYIKGLTQKARITSLTTLAAITILMAQLLLPAAASAACNVNANSSTGQIISGAGQTVGAGSPDCSGSGITNIAHSVVAILGDLVGIIAIIMILVAGFKYITSGGESNKVSSAKTTLIYAMIGIAIAAIAQVLVHVVLSTATSATAVCPSNHSILISDHRCH